jgi:DNA-binding PadR family transcriptional regulator
MVRYHYGPWDKRYYQVLGYLEARGLLSVEVGPSDNAFVFTLTKPGKSIAKRFSDEAEFSPVVEQMKRVKKSFGNKPGSTLKNLIYETFGKEVADRPLDEVIT